MPQGVLAYKYEEEKNDTGMTALAGLPVYLDFAHMIRTPDVSHSVFPGRVWKR